MPDRNDDLHGSAPDTHPVALLLIDVINDFDFPEADAMLPDAVAAARNMAALKGRARAAGVRVRTRARVERAESGGVRLDGGERLRAPLVVGADGLHSVVREAVHEPREPDFTGQVAWRALVRAEQPAPLTRALRYFAERFAVPKRDGLRVAVDRDPVSLM